MTQPTDKPTPEEIARWRGLADAAKLPLTRLVGSAEVDDADGKAFAHCEINEAGFVPALETDTPLTRDQWVVAKAKADLVTEAVNALPRLCDRVAALEAENAKLRAEVERRSIIAQRMSNLCFNLSQESVTFEPRHRVVMRDLYKQWDGPIAQGRAKP